MKHVVPGHPAALLLHRRVGLPASAAPTAWRFRPGLRCVAGWTRGSIADLADTFVPIDDRDFARVDAALVALAKERRTPARRPAHRRPRTPGRRALLEGVSAVRGATAGAVRAC